VGKNKNDMTTGILIDNLSSDRFLEFCVCGVGNFVVFWVITYLVLEHAHVKWM